jgi:putative methyltransferase (TIGR04325 family)
VFDLGGSAGGYFYELRRALPGIDWDWIVIETKAQLAAIRGVPPEGLSFTDQRPEGVCDVALISGALQYFPNPYATLAEYAAVSRSLVVSRCPVADYETVTVQQVREFGSFPAWIFARDKLELAFVALGNVSMQWDCLLDQISHGMRRIRHHGYAVDVHRITPEANAEAASRQPRAE